MWSIALLATGGKSSLRSEQGQQPGVVARRPVDLLRQRTRTQDEIEMDIWRVRWIGGSPERLTSHAGVSFLTVLNSRTLLYLARSEDWSGPWLWALDVERRGVTTVSRPASISSRRSPQAATAAASSLPWRIQLQRSQACRCSIVWPTIMMRSRINCRCLGGTRGARFGGLSLFYLSAGGSGDGLWKVQDGHDIRNLEEYRRCTVRASSRLAGWAARGCRGRA